MSRVFIENIILFNIIPSYWVHILENYHKKVLSFKNEDFVGIFALYHIFPQFVRIKEIKSENFIVSLAT